MTSPNLSDRLRVVLPEFSLPTLTKEVEIPIYLVHSSPDPEDYFFLFGFEEFVERSRAGVFVRPVIRIYAGRDDFSRTIFARQFREVFAAEFDRMRAELQSGKGKHGWLDWNLSFGHAVDFVSGLIGNIVLALALSAGRKILGNLLTPRFLKGKSAEAKLADEIDRTKTQVETALQEVKVTIHPELYEHAYRDGPMGKISNMDRDAWPLPDYVRAHMDQGDSRSWW